MNAARASLLALLLCWAGTALALVAVPPLSGRVVDQTGTLTAGDVASLTQMLRDLETRKGSQVAVLIVPTIDGEAIEQYSLRVAEAWKIGRKKIDDGALLVVAKNDRHLRIEVGYGLEGALTDVTTKRIIDEVITPKFKNGDFAGGISAGIGKMIALINGEKLPAPEPAHWDTAFEEINPLWLFILPFLLGGPLRATLGRLVGSIVTGGALAALMWFTVGNFTIALVVGVVAFVISMVVDLLPLSGGGSSSSIGSGGGWSSGSSSSSDSGSFSGGGGSFGGGGASGSW